MLLRLSWALFSPLLLLLLLLLPTCPALYFETPAFSKSFPANQRAGSSLQFLDLGSDSKLELLLGAPGESLAYLLSINATGATVLASNAGPPSSRFGRRVAAANQMMFAGAEARNGTFIDGGTYNLTYSGGSLTSTKVSTGTNIMEEGFDNSAVYSGTQHIVATGAPGYSLQYSTQTGNAVLLDQVLVRTYNSPTGTPNRRIINQIDSTKTYLPYFGRAVNVHGKFNGDNTPDIIIGAPRRHSTPMVAVGWVGAYSGASGTAPFWGVEGEQLGSYFGGSLEVVDVNNDGFDDLLVGAPYFSASLPTVGKVYLFLGDGSSLLTTPKWTYVGENEGEQFGFSITAIGDVNKDGYQDVAIGSPYYLHGTGALRVFLGGSNGLSSTPHQLLVGPFDHSLCQGLEDYSFPDGSDYRGTLNVTENGLTCQKWTSQTPHIHVDTPDSRPSGGLGDHNYCRNPDGDVKPWCYTTDPTVVWQYCNVGPRCKNLETAFGYSMSSKVDLNGDTYPDLAVGKFEASGFEVYFTRPVAHLALDLKVSPSPLKLGESVSVQICITNSGPSDAHQVNTTYTLPSQILPALAPQTSSFFIAVIGAGTTSCTNVTNANYTLPLDTNPFIKLTFSASAQMLGDSYDLDTSASQKTLVVGIKKLCSGEDACIVDLALSATTFPEPLHFPQDLNLNVTISSLSTTTDAAYGVILESTGLPSTVYFKSSTNKACQASTGGFYCNLGALAPSDLPLAISLVFEAVQFTGDIISQTITIETESSDQDLLNNALVSNATVIRDTDLELAIRAPGKTIVAGKTSPFTFEVVNRGYLTSSLTIITITWDPRITIESINTTKGICQAGGVSIGDSPQPSLASFQCSLGDIAFQEKVELVVTALAPDSITTAFSFMMAINVTAFNLKEADFSDNYASLEVSVKIPNAIVPEQVSEKAPWWASLIGVLVGVGFVVAIGFAAWKFGFFNRHLPPQLLPGEYNGSSMLELMTAQT